MSCTECLKWGLKIPVQASKTSLKDRVFRIPAMVGVALGILVGAWFLLSLTEALLAPSASPLYLIGLYGAVGAIGTSLLVAYASGKPDVTLCSFHLWLSQGTKESWDAYRKDHAKCRITGPPVDIEQRMMLFR